MSARHRNRAGCAFCRNSHWLGESLSPMPRLTTCPPGVTTSRTNSSEVLARRMCSYAAIRNPPVPHAESHTVLPISGFTISTMTRMRWRGVRNCAERFCWPRSLESVSKRSPFTSASSLERWMGEMRSTARRSVAPSGMTMRASSKMARAPGESAGWKASLGSRSRRVASIRSLSGFEVRTLQRSLAKSTVSPSEFHGGEDFAFLRTTVPVLLEIHFLKHLEEKQIGDLRDIGQRVGDIAFPHHLAKALEKVLERGVVHAVRRRRSVG